MDVPNKLTHTKCPAFTRKKRQMYIAMKTNETVQTFKGRKCDVKVATREGTHATSIVDIEHVQEGIKTNETEHVQTLQSPHSDVKVDILEGTEGILVGHVELNPTEYLQHFPENECIIAAIPDYTFYPKNNDKQALMKNKFRVTIKHTLENSEDLAFIRVRHGDIHKGNQFEVIPHKDNKPKGSEVYWEADISNIIITTTHFSQFLCTSCKVICDTRLVAFVTGTIREIDLSCQIAESVLFMCPLQFTTREYKMVSEVPHQKMMQICFWTAYFPGSDMGPFLVCLYCLHSDLVFSE